MIIDNIRFIALIPHRDAVRLAECYRRKLFEQGFSAAFSFPQIIPLIITKKPYTLSQLKQTAALLRKTVNGTASGKFFSQEAVCINLFPGLSLGGLSFAISHDALLLTDGSAPFPRFILGLSVLKTGSEASFLNFVKQETLPSFSFRACSAANVIYRVSDDGVYSWEIGHPVWLPSVSRETKNG